MDRYLLLSFIYLSNYIFTILSCISELPSGICLSSFWVIYLEVSSMKAICKYALSVVFILHVFIFPHPQDSLTRYTQFYVEDYFLWNLWKILFHIIFFGSWLWIPCLWFCRFTTMWIFFIPPTIYTYYLLYPRIQDFHHVWKIFRLYMLKTYSSLLFIPYFFVLDLITLKYFFHTTKWQQVKSPG